MGGPALDENLLYEGVHLEVRVLAANNDGVVVKEDQAVGTALDIGKYILQTFLPIL